MRLCTFRDVVSRNLTSALVPLSLRRSVVISDANALPRYWPTVFEASQLSGLKDKTARRTLNAIDGLYGYAEDLYGKDCLDELLWRQNADEIGAILEGFFNAGETAPFKMVWI